MTDLIKILNNPEEHYPGNFDTPQRANALLTGLCQDAANEIERLNAEVLEQCRINGMSAEREDALRAELTRLKAIIALDKKAENARELGLDYEPAVQERNFCERCGKRLGGDGHIHTCTPPAAQPAPVQEKNQSPYPEYDRGFSNGWDRGFAAAQPAPVQDLPFGVGGGLVAIKTLLSRDPCVHANTAIEMIDAILKEHPAAQPAVQEGRDWSLLEATQESLREHMAEIKRLKAAQKPWVGLEKSDMPDGEDPMFDHPYFIKGMVYAESKLKGKNHG
jgi:hypothetical protein